MKRNALSRIKALILTGALTAALLATPASAAFSYTPVTGTSTTFAQAIILDEGANVPSTTVAYSIAPGAAIAADDGKFEVIRPEAGTNGVTGTPTIASVTFAPGDAIATAAEAAAAGVTLDEGEKAVIKTATVNFSGVTFAEPGVYRYLVNMTSANQQGMAYDTQPGSASAVSKQRVLDVYVTDNGTALVISSYVFHELVADLAAGDDYGSAPVQAQDSTDVADKSKGFVNEYATYDLTISNTVVGNQGSRDKYFKFTVSITNAGGSVDLDVDMSNAAGAPLVAAATLYAADVMGLANSLDQDDVVEGQQWTTDGSGTVTRIIYLQDGQSVVIKGLAQGAGYSVTVDGEDYKVTSTNAELAANDPDDDEVNGMVSDMTAAFVLTRNGIIPTGVIMPVIPGVMLLAFSFFFLILIRRRKEEEAAEEA